jgi:penicillin-binding protein 1A
MQLGRQDLAGKTGTTSDSMDAWFAGFHPTLVAVTWVGYDNPQSLGEKETGGGAALPIWMDYMGKMLKDTPEVVYTVPEHIVTAHINDKTGLLDPDSPRVEYFYEENLPPEQVETTPEESKPATINDQLF